MFIQQKVTDEHLFTPSKQTHANHKNVKPNPVFTQRRRDMEFKRELQRINQEYAL